jgi:hypothetical protein
MIVPKGIFKGRLRACLDKDFVFFGSQGILELFGGFDITNQVRLVFGQDHKGTS